MVRVMVLYEIAPDPKRYEEHATLCRQVPGVTFRHGPVFGTPTGEEPEFGYYAEFEFADRDAFKAAARSPEFNATGPDAVAMGIPFKAVFAEVE
jgi:uncharacterized protein (TIGR02118 family)